MVRMLSLFFFGFLLFVYDPVLSNKCLWQRVSLL